MDTGATSHLASDTCSLLSFSNNSTMKSVLVGNVQSIPVTHTGHSSLHTPYKPLHLHNIFITPNIIKMLIYVRRFTSDNNVSIEFDPCGFSMKDLAAHQVLLRCDNSGDIYPNPTTTQSPVALLSTSPSLWYHRLGRPGAHVFNKLVSRHFIPCNKTFANVNYFAS